MDIFDIIYLLGGLGLFLYGMKTMSDGLEKLAGDKLGLLIDKMTGNRIKAVAVGAGVTAVIQSSSATTVMVIGFINAGVMTLKQAVGVIMGANIGTTITSQILALGDISDKAIFLQFLKPNNLAQFCVVAGVILLMFLTSKNKRNMDIGQILAGFGILFIGLTHMESAVSGLRDLPQFQEAIIAFKNPVVGVLTGMVITAVIQSSSASIGILQAATVTGQITLSAAVPIILGQNIGTCITAIISCIGANKNAKRAAFIHLTFNVIGTILFLILLYATPIRMLIPMWDQVTNRQGIANFHMFFNIANTIILFPFANGLVALANWVIRGDDHERVVVLDERLLATPAVALGQVKKEIVHMLEVAKKNVSCVYRMAREGNLDLIDKINKNEDTIDEMEAQITQYLVKIVDEPSGNEESDEVSSMLHVVNDIERIGDHACNISDSLTSLLRQGMNFTEKAAEELHVVHKSVLEILNLAIAAYDHNDLTAARRIQPCEDVVDDLKDILKDRHVDRLTQHECTIKSGVVFLDLLSNYERIADHCSNIGLAVEQMAAQDKAYDPHHYLQELHQEATKDYERIYEYYKEKFSV